MAVRDVRGWKLLRHLADFSEAPSCKELFVNYPAASLVVPHGIGAPRETLDPSVIPCTSVAIVRTHACSVRTCTLLIPPSAFPTSTLCDERSIR